MADSKLRDELGRVATLRRFAILDTPPEPAFDQVVNLVRTALGVPMAAVTLIDERRQTFKAAEGIAPDDTELDEAICTQTIKGRRPLIVPDAENDDRFADLPNVMGQPFIRSYLGVPLVSADGYNLGTLCAMDNRPRNFSDAHVALMEKFAGLVMDQIELRQIGKTDEQTGAMTRRGFFREVEREFFRSARYGRPASLVFFDIDNLREVNEAHGRAIGDQVLQAVARASLGKLRQSDAFGRLGGDEFAMLLPETGAAAAVLCAERVRELIEGLTIRGERDSVKVTASFGTAALTEAMASAAQWFSVADVALYQAKRSGRGVVVSADPEVALSPRRAAQPARAVGSSPQHVH